MAGNEDYFWCSPCTTPPAHGRRSGRRERPGSWRAAIRGGRREGRADHRHRCERNETHATQDPARWLRDPCQRLPCPMCLAANVPRRGERGVVRLCQRGCRALRPAGGGSLCRARQAARGVGDAHPLPAGGSATADPYEAWRERKGSRTRRSPCAETVGVGGGLAGPKCRAVLVPAPRSGLGPQR